MGRDQLHTISSEGEAFATAEPTQPTTEFSTLTSDKMVNCNRVKIGTEKLREAILLIPMDMTSVENLGRDGDSSKSSRKTSDSHLGSDIL